MLSIVIPVYNDIDGLVETIQSLGDFTNASAPVEVIVVDNNSSTPITLDNDDVKIVREIRRGSYNARNTGMALARNEWVLFLDADVELIGMNVEGILDLCRRTKLEYIGFDVQMKLVKNNAYSVFNYYNGFDVNKSMTEHNYTPTCVLLVTKKCLLECGPFDGRLESGGDFFFGQKVHEKHYQMGMDERVRFSHPTRSSRKSLLKKASRIAEGNKKAHVLYGKDYLYLRKRHIHLRNLSWGKYSSWRKKFQSLGVKFTLLEYAQIVELKISMYIVKIFKVL